MSAFRDWLAKAQPLLAAPGADKLWPGVVDGMELAWDAALEAAAMPSDPLEGTRLLRWAVQATSNAARDGAQRQYWEQKANGAWAEYDAFVRRQSPVRTS